MAYIGNVKVNKLFQQLNGKVYYFLKHKATGKYVSGTYRCRFDLPDRAKGTGKFKHVNNPNDIIDHNEYNKKCIDTPYHASDYPPKIYKEITESEAISLTRKNGSWGDVETVSINSYAEVRAALIKAKAYRQKLIKNNIIFLDDENRQKFNNLNFKKMTDAEILEFVTNLYTHKVPYFQKSSYGIMKTDKIDNVKFYENPALLFHQFIEQNWGGSMEAQMGSVIPKVKEILEIFDIHKVEFGVKEDDVLEEDQLMTDLTVSIINAANKKSPWD